MRRLIEEPGVTPIDQAVRRVLASAPALEDAPARRQRIRRALDAPAGARRRPRTAVILVAAALFCALGGTALAMGTGVLRRIGLSVRSVPEQVDSKTEQTPRSAPPERFTPPPPPTAQDGVDSPVPTPSAKTEQASAAPRRTTGRTSEPTSPPSRSDIDLVHEAATALRTGHDPARAARLLDSVRSPGPLAEEALALRIEAALDLRDPRAAALGSEYLSRFPGGAYREIAERALNSPR